MRIVLVGASGFFGRYLLQALVNGQHHCVVLTRAAERQGAMNLLPGVELVQADVYDVNVLAQQFAGADSVVSMAGVLNAGGRAGRGFDKVHVELVDTIIQACGQAGVSRLLHVSALHAGEGTSHYLRSKGEAEALLNTAEGLNVTIFQPSVMFGPGDGFFNRFALLLRLTPVLPLACPTARLQPVYAVDVATAMAASLEDPMTWGKSFALAGPQSFTLKALVKWTAEELGQQRIIIGLPAPLSATLALLMGLVPGKPFSWDNYQSLQTDSTTEQNDFAYFGIEPCAIDMVVPDYLTGSIHQRRLQSFRRRSRR